MTTYPHASLARRLARRLARLAVFAGVAIGGWAALRPARAAGPAITAPSALAPVVLPPYVVAEDKPWQYAATPGCEYLSRCTDKVTIAYARRLHRLDELLAAVLPPQFQFETTVPFATILAPPEHVSESARDLITGIAQKNAAADGRDGQRWGNTRFFPNMALGDIDTIALFMILDPKQVDPSRVIYTPVHVRLMLNRATPALPRWFAAGFIRLFDDMQFRDTDILLGPMPWLSGDATTSLGFDPEYPRTLLAMPEFFASWEKSGPVGDVERGDLAAAQAALFIRWGLADSRREAFWRFLADACQRPVTDAMIEGYLGCDLAELRDRLSDYLPVAVHSQFVIAPAHLTELPRVEVRPASPADVSRIVGNWQRLEVRYLRLRNPEYVPGYLKLARGTVERALKRNPFDAPVNAIGGLLELDAGDPAGARPRLEAAFAGNAAYPRVYLELARLRYRAAAGAQGLTLLDAAQTQSVLQPLEFALQHPPAMAEAYAVAAEVMARSAPGVPLRYVALVERGIAEFPRDLRLLFWTSLVEVRAGAVPKAIAFAERGRAEASTDAVREEFDGLLKKLRSGPKHSGASSLDLPAAPWNGKPPPGDPASTP